MGIEAEVSLVAVFSTGVWSGCAGSSCRVSTFWIGVESWTGVDFSLSLKGSLIKGFFFSPCSFSFEQSCMSITSTSKRWFLLLL
jgi:hypothetical protein